MREVINLRRAKKRMAKAAAEQQAQENRLRFGQPKGVRNLDAAKTAQAAKRLDQHKLTPGKDK